MSSCFCSFVEPHRGPTGRTFLVLFENANVGEAADEGGEGSEADKAIEPVSIQDSIVWPRWNKNEFEEANISAQEAKLAWPIS